MADSFEIMKVWVPLNLHYQSNRKEEAKFGEMFTVTNTPIDDDRTSLAWEKASDMAKDGWELVGAVPLTGYSFPAMEGASMGYTSSRPRDLSNSFTTGYELLFKRRIEKS